MTMMALAAMMLGMLGSGARDKGESLAVGPWGGMHIALTVNEKDARIELDCAHGAIDGAISLDKDGHFEAKGRYVPERPGPVRLGDPDRSQPARYVGDRKEDKLTLTIVLEDGQTVGPFELTKGSRARVMKCR